MLKYYTVTFIGLFIKVTGQACYLILLYKNCHKSSKNKIRNKTPGRANERAYKIIDKIFQCMVKLRS